MDRDSSLILAYDVLSTKDTDFIWQAAKQPGLWNEQTRSEKIWIKVSSTAHWMSDLVRVSLSCVIFLTELLWCHLVHEIFHIVKMISLLKFSQIIFKHNILHYVSFWQKVWVRQHGRSQLRDDPVMTLFIFFTVNTLNLRD